MTKGRRHAKGKDHRVLLCFSGIERYCSWMAIPLGVWNGQVIHYQCIHITNVSWISTTCLTLFSALNAEGYRDIEKLVPLLNLPSSRKCPSYPYLLTVLLFPLLPRLLLGLEQGESLCWVPYIPKIHTYRVSSLWAQVSLLTLLSISLPALLRFHWTAFILCSLTNGCLIEEYVDGGLLE